MRILENIKDIIGNSGLMAATVTMLLLVAITYSYISIPTPGYEPSFMPMFIIMAMAGTCLGLLTNLEGRSFGSILSDFLLVGSGVALIGYQYRAEIIEAFNAFLINQHDYLAYYGCGLIVFARVRKLILPSDEGYPYQSVDMVVSSSMRPHKAAD